MQTFLTGTSDYMIRAMLKANGVEWGTSTAGFNPAEKGNFAITTPCHTFIFGGYKLVRVERA